MRRVSGSEITSVIRVTLLREIGRLWALEPLPLKAFSGIRDEHINDRAHAVLDARTVGAFQLEHF